MESQVGLFLCAAYLLLAAVALIGDLTNKPSIDLMMFSKALPWVALPGMVVVMILLSLVRLDPDDVNAGWRWTVVSIVSALVTAVMAYLLGAGVEALFRACIS